MLDPLELESLERATRAEAKFEKIKIGRQKLKELLPSGTPPAICGKAARLLSEGRPSAATQIEYIQRVPQCRVAATMQPHRDSNPLLRAQICCVATFIGFLASGTTLVSGFVGCIAQFDAALRKLSSKL
jgi:hypothetical protein